MNKIKALKAKATFDAEKAKKEADKERKRTQYALSKEGGSFLHYIIIIY